MSRSQRSFAIVACSVVFTALVAGSAGGELPPGFEIVQITFDPDHDIGARINNCGQFVFSKRIGQLFDQEEIFLYGNNGDIVQITDDEVRDAFPDINDAGTIVWTRYAADFERNTVMMLIEGQVIEIGFGGPGVINNLGHIAWMDFDPTLCASPSNVFFFDGQSVQQITNDGLSHQATQINDLDEITWTRYDFCLDPWESHIMLYSAGTIQQLTEEQRAPQNPRINNLSQVAWESRDPANDRFIELWQDGVTSVVTHWGSGPKLNNLSDLAFSRWDDEVEMGWAWLYRSGDFFQISDGSVITGVQDINDFGEMVLFINHGYPNSDLSLLRRVRDGDLDIDGDVDVADHAVLAGCLSGPAPSDTLCECRFFDLDFDRDVDMGDYQLFLEYFTGSP